MPYFFSKSLSLPFDQALAAEGFGVLTDTTNPGLASVASQVQDKLRRVIESL